jgi:hypothetical protein
MTEVKKENSKKEKFVPTADQLRKARAAGIVVRYSVPKIRKALRITWSEAHQIHEALRAADRS